MIICSNCKKEMSCVKNEALYVRTVDHAPDSIRMGDKWRCGNCNSSVITAFGSPLFRYENPDLFKILLEDAEESDDSVFIDF